MLYLFLLFYFSNYLFSDLVYKHVDVGRAKYRQERILSWYCTFPITEDWNFQAPNWLSAASKIPLYFFSLVLASMNSFLSLVSYFWTWWNKGIAFANVFRYNRETTWSRNSHAWLAKVKSMSDCLWYCCSSKYSIVPLTQTVLSKQNMPCERCFYPLLIPDEDEDDCQIKQNINSNGLKQWRKA